MNDSYLFERKYKEKNTCLNISEEWEKILGKSTLEMLCNNYMEVTSFLNESKEYCLKNELLESEYSKILGIYKKGQYIYETIEDDRLKDKLFYTFYVPFLKLAQYYGKLEYGVTIEKYYLMGIQDEIYNSLSHIAIRILVNEIQFLKNELLGRDAEEKYLYYVMQYLCDSEYIEEIFQFYPLLLRCMLEKICMILAFFNQILNRWEKDLPAIYKCMQLSDTTIVQIRKVGDNHRNGQSTVKISFKDGSNIFYKPRSLKIAKIYYELLNELYLSCGLRGYDFPILDYEEYGWEKGIEYIPCKNKKELQHYYMRMGIQLMLSYVLDIQDLHYENLIAHGEFPIFVDVEIICGNITKYQEKLSAEEKAEWMIESSVLGSGILPRNCRNKDLFCAINGIGGIETDLKIIKIVNSMTSDIKLGYTNAVTPDGQNIPYLDEKMNVQEKFAKEIVTGFNQAYQYISNNKMSFINRIRGFVSRLLINHTHNYVKLIQLSYHPIFMRDGGARQMILSKNFSLHMKKDMNIGKAIFESELCALVKGDIPYFSFSSDKRSLVLEKDKVLLEYLNIIPEEYIDMRIKNLSDKDFRFQQRLLSQVLKYTETYNAREINKELYNRNTAIEFCKQIGDYLINMVIYDNSYTDVTWIIPSGYAIRVSDMYLYEGISGMAVFFAALNRLAPTRQFFQMEQKLIRKLFNYTTNSKEIDAYSGAFCGEASIVYTYLLLYKITNNKQFIKHAEMHESKLLQVIKNDQKYDLLYGNAGAVVIYINLFEVTGNRKYLSRAKNAADYIIEKAKRSGEGIYWHTDEKKHSIEGLAHGGSGFSLCFTRLFEKTGEKKYLNIAIDAIKYEDKMYDDNVENWVEKEHQYLGKGRVYWCHGAGGIALARKEILKHLNGFQYEEILSDYQKALKKVKSTLDLNMRTGCLCHGMIGNMMIIKGLYESDMETLWRQCSSKIEDFIRNVKLEDLENGNPGFMMGLSGIGYGLLYMSQGKQILPNILQLKIK